MSLLTDIETIALEPLTLLEDAWTKLAPPALVAEVGPLLSSAWVSNIVYDAKKLGQAAELIGQDDIAQIWGVCKTAAGKVVSDLQAGKFTLSVSSIVGELTDVGATQVFPALALIGKTTLTTMVQAACSIFVSGVVAPPAAAAPAPSKS